MITAYTIPTNIDLPLNMNDVRESSEAAHKATSDLFSNSNRMYNVSSVSEDVIMDRYLSVYNSSKALSASRIGSSKIVESFTTKDYVDENFTSTKTLNIDTQNGTATLPVVSTTDLEVGSIIIESDSNGEMGNSMQQYQNNDINAILSSDASSLFEYEKITNIFTDTTLELALTLRLTKTGIANAIFVKLQSDSSALYPVIDYMQVSEDGVEWTDISIAVDTNRNEYFVRFLPQKIQYARMRFTQTSSTTISTSFGSKYRYMIGLRQISIKAIEYQASGEYVSTPFAAKHIISKLIFSKVDNPSTAVSYFISANNGGKWLPIKATETFLINNTKLGVREDSDIDSFRVKIQIDRSKTPYMKSAKEMFLYADPAQFTLKNKPATISAYLGGHISVGETVTYVFPVADTSKMVQGNVISNETTIVLPFIPFSNDLVEKIVVKVNGLELVNQRSVYSFIQHPNPMFSVLRIKSAETYGVVELYYRPITFKGTQTLNLDIPLLETEPTSVVVGDLGPEDFTILDRKTIVISQSAYYKDKEYVVTYMPGFDVTSFIVKQDDANVKLNSLGKVPDNAKVNFEYSYDDNSQNGLSKFYSPLCNEYRIEIV